MENTRSKLSHSDVFDIFYILKMDPEKGEESPEHRVDRAGSTELSTVHVRGPKCFFDMQIHY